jgi:hypothetical protein
MSVVPILIRQHLVPFFFKESEGEEFNYGGKRGKSVLFSPMVSPIGRIMRLLMVKAGKPLKVNNFNLYLSISDSGNGKKYQGQFYKHESGRNSFLMLPQDANEDINDFLEAMFRMSFISYMNGCVENNPEAVVTIAIDKWIAKYDLEEFGFSNDTLRRLYYREKEKNKIVCRFQTAKSSNVLNGKPSQSVSQATIK